MTLIPLICCFFLPPQQKPGEKPIPGKLLILPQDYLKKKKKKAICSSVFQLLNELLTISTEVLRDSGIAPLCKVLGKSRALCGSRSEIEEMSILLPVLKMSCPFHLYKLLPTSPNAGNGL